MPLDTPGLFYFEAWTNHNPHQEATHMDNIITEMEGTVLVIRADLAKENGRSKSGKTITIASTRGAAAAPQPFEQVKINLNIYKYPE